MPPAAAVGIGGSAALGRAGGDWDYFVFFDEGDVFAEANLLRSFLKRQCGAQVVSWSEVRFVDGFGLCSSALTADGGLVEIFANTPSSWTANWMRAGTRVLIDTSGLFSSLIAEPPPSPVAPLVHDICVQYWKAEKWLARRDSEEITYRLAKMAHLARQLLRHLDVRDAIPQSPSFPRDTQARQYVARLLRTVEAALAAASTDTAAVRAVWNAAMVAMRRAEIAGGPEKATQ